jgi:hypothetical protein
VKLIAVFFLGVDVGVLIGVFGCGLFAFVIWLRLRNKNRGG